jgi:hypothetical protein
MTTDSAVVVISPVDQALDQFPSSAFNRLIPTETIRIPTDLLVPVVQIVRLSLDENDKDVYSSRDIPNGHKAPTARGLNKLATAAGVSFYDERRTDDGSNPDLIGVTVMASMLLPTGQRITAPGSKQIDLSAQSWASPAQRAKYKSFFYEHVSTRARNRAIRALLSLKQSYTNAELAKPFAVVSYAPNMDHPLIRQRMIDNLAPAVAQLYGGAGDAAQLGPGTPVQEIRALPADVDDDADGADASTGDDDLPPFLRPDQPAAAAEPTLLVRIRDISEAGGMVGGAKAPQIESLQEIFKPLGGRATTAGLQTLWPQLDVNALTANQAQAIIGTARSYETPEAFQAAWREMAGLE